jgi:hypothetical protein
MRELRFVTLTEDGGQLLLEGTDGAERFTVGIDDALRAALQAALLRRPLPRHSPAEAPAAEAPAAAAPAAAMPAPEPVAQAPISPREIQVRVRAGESPEQLAAAYGMTLDRVMRFAGAAVDERMRIKDEARRARARRNGSDGEGRLVQFGEAVDERFRAHGIDAEAVSWDSRRRDDGEWLVVASWLGGDSRHSAEWLFSRTSRTVTPLDDTASDLLSDRPIRPIVPPEPPRPALSMAPPLLPGVVAFPPMPDAETGRLPRVDEVFDQEAHPEGPRSVPPFVPAAAPTLDFDEPPLPLGITDPATRPAAAQAVGAMRNVGVSRRDETEEERAARARIPSWDDILLGIKRRD